MKIFLTVFLLMSLLAPVASPPAQPEPVVQTAAKAQAPLQATYILFGSHFLPLSLFQGGQSLIDYSQWGMSVHTVNIAEALRPFIDALQKADFYYYTLPNHNQKSVRISYDDILADHEKGISPLVPQSNKFPEPLMPGIATTNSSPDFMADTRYHNYTVTEQSDIPKRYIDYVRRKLNTAGLVNTPVIIQELWEYDFDGDGKKEAFIVATNLLPSAEAVHSPKAASPSRLDLQEGIGYYSYVLFYSETYAPIDFETYSELLHDCFYPAFCRPFIDPNPIYLFDKQGDVQFFNMWLPEEPNTEYRLYFYQVVPAICDLNGDGLYDFLLLRYREIYTPCRFYLQNNQGEFIFSGSVETPA